LAHSGWQKQFEGQVQLGGVPEQPPLPLLPPLPPMQKPSSGSAATGAMQVPLEHGTEPFGLHNCAQLAPSQNCPAAQSWERSWRVALMLQLVVAVPPW
jgi:hypothetical protein